MMDKNELRQQLQSNVAKVVFEKADGTLREMRCTLLAEHLPVSNTPQVAPILGENVRPENPNVLAVWDIENGGWRSFRMDSIKSIAVGV
jgi:hypothetical protein